MVSQKVGTLLGGSGRILTDFTLPNKVIKDEEDSLLEWKDEYSEEQISLISL